MTFKEFYNKYKEKALIGAISLATIIGTYSGNEGIPPFINRKAERSYGINIGVGNEFLPNSEFYGISIGLVNIHDGGKINGLEISIFNSTSKNEEDKDIDSYVNGIQFGAINSAKGGNALQLGLANKMVEGNSLQVGVLANSIGEGRGLQVGVCNIIQLNGKKKIGLLLNYNFKK